MSADPAVPGRLASSGYKERLKLLAHATLDPVVAALERMGLQPDHVTVAGLVLSVVAGVAFYDGQNRVAALVLIVAGVCDILDGQLARRAGRSSRYGAFLDSTLDRLAESAVLVGIAGYYASNLLGLHAKSQALLEQVVAGEVEGPIALLISGHQPVDPVAWLVLTITAMLALVGSFMVSYTRARAEGLGLECKVGWFERPERIVLLIVAGLIQVFWAMSAALLLLAILSFTTAAQRVMHVHRITRGAGADERA